ncbi:MAG: hypothetical protein A3I11_06230 [Elusimicrobia bacterium RIFCSPLOWO2_02_FULL_39_32]|nr:MAG: hypothetical protein A2034_02635 [Elusimicrobia bacterium GWA2_38_7]OGR80960.1 MAG: hypothetical protein A3B80_04765 [Elusimicrobia bacterium RIFCSPHIGHO2_02_FULL_39_36]OGR91667.1 MAG: hypothetical protein A3I11_06230 [Elusimicrobia bacterium RIFCSPLOWO2_02_FULL_39_32]OGS00919.1 MAG: hypothetical protein A3G85_00360 [Elusimicrobia bacterium RIFCSPLOWO2_12_FULL_39_28]
MTHPFHPLRGESFRFVVSKPLWGEDRVTLQFADNTFNSVPLSWTDLAPKNPYLSLGKGRSRFRVEDLLLLSDLIKDGGQK